MSEGAGSTAALIYVDGASRGNPGPAAAGALILEADGKKTLATLSQSLGVATNNEAEYWALILALEKAIELGVSRVEIRADSQLVVRQITGEYKVKHPAMKTLHAKASLLLGRLSAWSAAHVPREENQEADKLANAALDRDARGSRS